MLKSFINGTMNISDPPPFFNDTMEEMQELQFSLKWVVTLSCLYATTTVFSVFGNVMVILVFFKGRQSKTDLRPYLVNLAVADLIMAVFCMPFTFGDVVFRSWIFSDPMCPIVIFMQTLSVSASVFINVAIGIDRLLVVLYPLKCKRSKSRTKLVLIFIWLMSLILACMVAPVGKVDNDEGRYQCQEVWPSQRHNQIFTIVIFILTYALPLLILTISYSIVGIILWKRTSPGNSHHVRDLMQLRAKVKVVKMLIVVVAMFGICWMPLHILNVILNFRTKSSSREGDTMAAIYISAHWLAMANSFANPIIYSFTNSIFRNDLVALLYSCFPCCCCCLRSYLPYRNPRFGHVTTRYACVSKSSPYNSNRSWAVSFRSYQNSSLSSRRTRLSSSLRQTRLSINSSKSTPSLRSSRTLSKRNNNFM
ncbi:RYamide receptor-like [Saccostrea cucullata]|uniref:RYamide receptor-like n=1 Tax=Saccostrea cuccullata TaxID=36930 RepID=UPI002ED52C1A